VGDVFTACGEGVENFLLVGGGELVLVAAAHKFGAGVDEQVALSRLDFFSTMMQVAIVVPKNRSGGNWITAST
jgi:hypothetical protein